MPPYLWAKAEMLLPLQFAAPGVPAKTGGGTKPLSVISNTVPELFVPPPEVVPKSLPLASAIRTAAGNAPSVQLGWEQNLTRVLGVLLKPLAVLTTSNTVPAPAGVSSEGAPPSYVVPKRLPL